MANEDCLGVASFAKPGISRWASDRGKLRLGRPERMAGNFYYVHVLVSSAHPERRYTGYASDLEGRLRAHNSGKCPHTSKFAPWCVETAIAFGSQAKAIAFERYLKSHSGRAFASKHFWLPCLGVASFAKPGVLASQSISPTSSPHISLP